MATKARSSWSDVKTGLALFDRAALLVLLKDLHALLPHNRAFLAARLGIGADLLAPHKSTISRWVRPDLTRGQHISIANAKKALSDYRKAIGRPEGLAELAVFFCEEAAGRRVMRIKSVPAQRTVIAAPNAARLGLTVGSANCLEVSSTASRIELRSSGPRN